MTDTLSAVNIVKYRGTLHFTVLTAVLVVKIYHIVAIKLTKLCWNEHNSKEIDLYKPYVMFKSHFIQLLQVNYPRMMIFVRKNRIRYGGLDRIYHETL